MSASFDDLVREVKSTMLGYSLIRDQVTFLDGSITNSALSATVDDGSLIQAGVIEIGSECLWVQAVDTTTNVLTISPDGRGWDGTTAASHADNVRVTVAPAFPAWRIARAINDTIVGTWPTLYGVGATSFLASPVVNTYELPTDCQNVLQVTATTIGPSGEQAEVHSYKYNANAPADLYASGKTVTLREAVDPGQTVTVVYQKAPSEIASGDGLTDSGLAETARACVIYGAVTRLMSFMDAVRLSTDSASAAQYDQIYDVGTATQVAAQLQARYQLELDNEQARLRKAHPVKARWIGR